MRPDLCGNIATIGNMTRHHVVKCRILYQIGAQMATQVPVYTMVVTINANDKSSHDSIRIRSETKELLQEILRKQQVSDVDGITAIAEWFISRTSLFRAFMLGQIDPQEAPRIAPLLIQELVDEYASNGVTDVSHPSPKKQIVVEDTRYIPPGVRAQMDAADPRDAESAERLSASLRAARSPEQDTPQPSRKKRTSRKKA